MTREEAIKYLSERVSIGKTCEQSCMVGFGVNIDTLDEALDMAISALREQEHFREVTKKEDPLTNAQKIRGMSDNELAKAIAGADWCEYCDQVQENGTCHAMELGGPLNQYCIAGCLKWLKQPPREEDKHEDY